MNPIDPVLDRPQSIDCDELDPDKVFRLANHDIVFHADGQTDLRDLHWPWAGAIYARHIKMRIRDMHDDDFMPMVTRFYPGYQETILGTEGMIVSKQLTVPFDSSYDRAVIWLLQCQAEGDRLLRLDIEIDWGEPLEQRIVDGLLVAQRDPQSARGLYEQRNAESTRVFGNPQARPQAADLNDPCRANLTYYVLVNGIIEVPMLLTISDVGEQVAWNGFLALRDSERAFQLSVREWERAVKVGRLWTPDPYLNHAVQAGRLAALRWTQRLRTGLAPSDRSIYRMAALVDSLDAVEPVQSRNLLAHLRRLAEKSDGALPAVLPLRRKDPSPWPGEQLPATNTIYFRALQRHLSHHHEIGLLAEHLDAVKLCANRIVAVHAELGQGVAPVWLDAAADALDVASALAVGAGDDADVARWESEAAEYRRQARQRGGAGAARAAALVEWQAPPSWRTDAGDLWAYDDPWDGIELAGAAVWAGCGLQWEGDTITVTPTFPHRWSWWALMALPWGQDGALTLLWDGKVLHATQPIRSQLPVVYHDAINALHTDEDDFDLRFELVDNEGGVPQRQLIRPEFLRE